MAKFFLLALAMAAVALSQSHSATIYALGVLKDCGVVTPIEVTLRSPGNGSVYVLGVAEAARGFKPSAELAYLVAARLAGVSHWQYDIYIAVYTNESKISGPSASAYIAVAVYSALRGISLRNDTAMTGLLLPTGLVGPVGGVTFKTSAAWRRGLSQVVLPIGGVLAVAHLRGRLVAVEAATVEEAIWHLTGVKITRLKSVDVSNYTYLMERLYEVYKSYVRAKFGIEIEPAVGSRYYVAFTLLLEEASGLSLTEDPEAVFREVEKEIAAVEATAANVDVLAATFMKLHEDYLERPSRLEARAEAARLWLGVAKSLGGRPVGGEKLREAAELYLKYAEVMWRYLSEIYVGDLSHLGTRVGKARRHFEDGRYVQSLALSLHATAYASAVLVGPPSIRLVDEARKVAFSRAAEAAACGSPATVPLSYIELGDYYKSSLDKLQQAFFYYTLSALYSMAVVDMACGSSLPIAGEEVEEMRLDLVLAAVAAAASLFAVAYLPAAVAKRDGGEV